MKLPKGYAFHFVGDTLRDGRPIPPDGEWLVHNGPARICETGLHFSYEPFDALQYATGNTLCLVEVADVVETESDKGVCRRRKIIARFDAEPILRYFARMQALSVVHLWETCPPDFVLDWLMTGDEAYRSAARSAADSAADSATYNAAYNAADSAARSAADSATYNAAYNAADSAAYSAAYSAADSAARSAADSATYNAAYNAADSAARLEFNSLIHAEFQSMGAL